MGEHQIYIVFIQFWTNMRCEYTCICCIQLIFYKQGWSRKSFWPNPFKYTWGCLSIRKLSYQYRNLMLKIIRYHYTLMWKIDTCKEWGIKLFQTRLCWVWNHFIPHESQVSSYHNQGVVDSLSRSSIKIMFWHKNTTIISVLPLSHHPHPN